MQPSIKLKLEELENEGVKQVKIALTDIDGVLRGTADVPARRRVHGSIAPCDYAGC